MRCNQVSISIERFGKYVPEQYPALRERFGLDEVQVRKLMQIWMDMLDRDSYEKIRQERIKQEKSWNGWRKTRRTIRNGLRRRKKRLPQQGTVTCQYKQIREGKTYEKLLGTDREQGRSGAGHVYHLAASV